MGIEVTVKQKLFSNKTIPLHIILGNKLRFGNFVGECLQRNTLGKTEFIAYHPEHIGRGFSVEWNENERKAVSLRLPLPSTSTEISDFYSAVARIVNYWNGTLFVDGEKTNLSNFMDGYERMVSYNENIIKTIFKKILDGESETLTLYSAMWALDAGVEDVEKFIENTENFCVWLHEKQSVNAYYCSPHFFENENGIIARYFIPQKTAVIFPTSMRIPMGLSVPKCEDWAIVFEAFSENINSEIEYGTFLEKLPKDKCRRFDGGHILIEEITEEEMKQIMS